MMSLRGSQASPGLLVVPCAPRGPALAVTVLWPPLLVVAPWGHDAPPWMLQPWSCLELGSEMSEQL